jgi:hypothetical protein
MGKKEKSSQHEQYIHLANKLMEAYSAGMRVDSGADMPLPAAIVGDAFDALHLPRAAHPNSTVAQTFRDWLQARVIMLLRQRDPRLKASLLDIRNLTFFYYNHVEEFLSNTQLAGDGTMPGRFTSVADLHQAWERLTGLKVDQLPRSSPFTKEQDLESVLGIGARAASYAVNKGLLLVFGIEEGRAHKPLSDLNSPLSPPAAHAAPQAEWDAPPGDASSDASQQAPSPPKDALHTPPEPASPPSDPQTLLDAESLVHLVRSVKPEQVFSVQSMAFALGLSTRDAGDMLQRWELAGWVTYYGPLHDMPAYGISMPIRLDALKLLAAQPALDAREPADFRQMPSLLKPASPLGLPYHGTALAHMFASTRSPSIWQWSMQLIDDLSRMGTAEATISRLQHAKLPLLVDRLSTLYDLSDRSQSWLRRLRWMIVGAIVALMLLGVGLAVVRSPALNSVALAGSLIAFGTLLYVWGVLHQTGRAWRVLWAEMGLLR